jgi:hypothetical protein
VQIDGKITLREAAGRFGAWGGTGNGNRPADGLVYPASWEISLDEYLVGVDLGL